MPATGGNQPVPGDKGITMTGLLLAAAFAGGLGVLLLALGALTSGMRLAGGSVL